MRSNTNLLRKRDEALYQDYIKTRKQWTSEKKHFSIRNLIEHVIKNGHPEYCFTFEYSRRMLACIINEPHSDFHQLKNRQQVWYELRDKVTDYISRHPQKSLSDAVAEILAFGRASQYFLSYQYAKAIIIRMTHEDSLYHCA